MRRTEYELLARKIDHLETIIHQWFVQAENTNYQRSINTMSALDDLDASVAKEEAVEASVIALLGRIKADLDEAIREGSGQKLAELSDRISKNADAMSAAVVANTPADPEPPSDEPQPPADDNVPADDGSAVETGAVVTADGKDAVVEPGSLVLSSHNDDDANDVASPVEPVADASKAAEQPDGRKWL